MSLINDMLRDLEERRRRELRQEPQATPAAVPKHQPRRLSQRVLIGLVTVLIVLLGAGWFFLSPRQLTDPPTVVETVPEILVPPLVEPRREMPLGADQVVVTETLIAPIQPLLTAVSINEEQDQLVLELTFTALPALAKVRPVPAAGQVVILLQDTHVQQGLVLPQSRLEQVRGISFLPTLAGLELIVAVGGVEQLTTTQTLEPRSGKMRIGLNFVSPSPATGEMAASEGHGVPAEIIATPVMALPVPRERQSPATAALVRTPPLPETDDQLYRRGLQQLGAGNLRAAQEHFSAALRLNPGHVAARLELIGLLQGQGDNRGALTVILGGLHLDATHVDLRRLYAHQLVQQGRYPEALEQLDQAPLPNVSADPDYHALRAAVYQELGAYPQAAELYARLLEQRPREALWWLGLAIALEQQGLGEGARDAYRTALDLEGLRPDLERFVRQRLQGLPLY